MLNLEATPLLCSTLQLASACALAGSRSDGSLDHFLPPCSFLASLSLPFGGLNICSPMQLNCQLVRRLPLALGQHLKEAADD